MSTCSFFFFRESCGVRCQVESLKCLNGTPATSLSSLGPPWPSLTFKCAKVLVPWGEEGSRPDHIDSISCPVFLCPN